MPSTSNMPQSSAFTPQNLVLPFDGMDFPVDLSGDSTADCKKAALLTGAAGTLEGAANRVLPENVLSPVSHVPPVPGVVYTRLWAVRLLLDLAGYTPDRDLASLRAVEPAAGTGAFLAEMARRLVLSCQRQGRPPADALSALLALEIDPSAAQAAKNAVLAALTCPDPSPSLMHPPLKPLSRSLAEDLAAAWVQTSDYLLDAPTLPPADLVVGNPPYVRLEDIDHRLAAQYRSAYPTMRGRADLYVGFYEAALRSLKPGGVCAFICADRWMRNQYGAHLRCRITEGAFQVEAVIEMHDCLPFEQDVSAYPALTVIRAAAQINEAQINHAATLVARLGPASGNGGGIQASELFQAAAFPSTGPLSAQYVSSWFSGEEPWPQESPERLALLRRLETRFPPLQGQYQSQSQSQSGEGARGTRVGIGVATGADRVFLTDDPTLVEPDCLLPLAFASDVAAGQSLVAWSGRYLVDTGAVPDEAALDGRYPRLAAYLRTHESALRARHIARRNPDRWFRTIDRVDRSLTARRKLYIPDIKGRLTPVLDGGVTYPHHNLYVVTSSVWDMEALGGLLLSEVAQFFVACYAVRMRGGYFRFQAQYLRRIRVPRPETIGEADQEELRQAFRAHDAARATRIARRLYGIEDVPAFVLTGRREPAEKRQPKLPVTKPVSKSVTKPESEQKR